MKVLRTSVILICLAALFSACYPTNEIAQPLSTASNTASPLNVTAALTNTDIPVKTPQPTETSSVTLCNPKIQRIDDFAEMYFWDDEDEILFYTTADDLMAWKTYPPQDSELDFYDVFPVMTPELKQKFFPDRGADAIYFWEVSFSPSREKMIYAVPGYTRPTPTPAMGEVSYTEFEWLLDFNIRTLDNSRPKFLTRMEGDMFQTYWQSDEKAIYLIFESMLVPSHGRVFRLDLESGMYEKLLPNDRYSYWFAISPDDKQAVYELYEQVDDKLAGIYLMDLETGNEEILQGLPEIEFVYWVDEYTWLLVDGNDNETLFHFYDLVTGNISHSGKLNANDGSITFRLMSPLSPSGLLLALNSDFNEDPYSLYIVELCPNLSGN